MAYLRIITFKKKEAFYQFLMAENMMALIKVDFNALIRKIEVSMQLINEKFRMFLNLVTIWQLNRMFFIQ